jgi:hypothetical protein
MEGFTPSGLTLSPWHFTGLVLFFFCVLPVLLIFSKRGKNLREKEIATRVAELEGANVNLGGEIIRGNKTAMEMEIFRSVFEESMDGMVIFDTEGKIVNVKMTRPSNQKTRDTFDSYSDL